jgi:hypothetical protein
MAEPVRYDVAIAFRCPAALAGLVRRAAAKRGTKEAQYLRDAVAASLKADGLDPAAEHTAPMIGIGVSAIGSRGIGC